MADDLFLDDAVDYSVGLVQFGLGLGGGLGFVGLQLAVGGAGAFGGIRLHELVQLLLETAQFLVDFYQFDLFLLCFAHS